MSFHRGERFGGGNDVDWRDRRGDRVMAERPHNNTGPMRGPPQQKEPEIEIDREKTCPLLMRVFTKIGTHHGLEDFAKADALPKEIQI
jgi:histone deacetylase complex subunit SAP18